MKGRSMYTNDAPIPPLDREPPLERLRYVQCDHCHGTGEIVHGIAPRHAYDVPSEYTTLCSACDGYGMECVETEPVTIDDIETDN